MNCPVCENTRMREMEKNGIMVDICPNCKGVWLDRGELEKLMKDVREVQQDYNEWYYGEPGQGQPPRPQSAPPAQPQYQQPQYQQPQQAYPQNPKPYYGSHPQGHPQGHPKYKKKKSVLDVFGDLFD
jgi:Zn-finger nucleic acid-binding protein